MKIPLSISVDYVPEWGVKEGLRETCQNWLDAKDKHGAGSVTYSRAGGGTVIFDNPTATISRDALLLGVSSKRGDTTQRGFWGEGIKLGTLALLREGKTVRFETPTEFWTASLEEHDAFPGRNVLVFNVRQRKAGEVTPGAIGVQVEVGGITKEEYDEMRSMFLAFSPDHKRLQVDTYAAILPDMPGRIYCKGVFIYHDKAMKFGYDIATLKVDRDRKMTDSWELRWKTSQVICAALKDGVMTPQEVYDLCDKSAVDVEHIAHNTDSVVDGMLASIFTQAHGGDAVPCESMSESAKAEHAGVRAIPVSPSLSSIVGRVTGDYRKKANEKAESITQHLGIADLMVIERASLQWACLAFEQATGINALDRVRIVCFTSPSIEGMHRGRDIFVARHVLQGRVKTLGVLIHEFSHDLGHDGDKSHVWNIEKTWEKVVEVITGRT